MERPKQKKRAYIYASFGLLLGVTQDRIDGVIAGLVQGHLNPNQFGAACLPILRAAHAPAYVMGAASVGVETTEEATEPYIDRVMAAQAEFLDGFVDQLKTGDKRYFKTLEELYPEFPDRAAIIEADQTGEINIPNEIHLPNENEPGYYDDHAIQERMKMYVERVRGTGNWGAIDALAPWEEIYWQLGPNENHCQDCPERASKTWRSNTLPGTPGDGSTECLVYCHCRLELADGTLIEF